MQKFAIRNSGVPTTGVLFYPTSMPPLYPRRDFRDDGGTRAWRANQATYGRVIDAGRPGLVGWYQRSSPGHIFLVVFVSIALGIPAAAIATLLLCWAFVP